MTIVTSPTAATLASMGALTLLTFCAPSTIALASYPLSAWERPARRVGVTVVLVLLALVPLLLPPDERLLRALLAIVVIFAAAKVFDVALQRQPRPSFRVYATFILNPFAAVLRRLEAEPTFTTRQNLTRLVVGLGCGVAGGAAMFFVHGHRASLPNLVVVQTLELLAFYLGLEGLLVAAATVLRLLGFKVRDVLERPALAVTPADFWRRYNRVIGQFLHEDVFLRVGGFRAPLRATLVTFFISALAHEYLFGIALGRVEGWQTLFFMSQGVAVAATVRLQPKGPWVVVSTALTLAFNVATSFLFYASVDGVVSWW
jgi:hypothetical protein